MGLFRERGENATVEDTADGAIPLASGLRLTSSTTPAEVHQNLVDAVSTYKEPDYPDLPLVHIAGWSWGGASETRPQTLLVCDSEDTHPVFISVWQTAEGSDLGLFPLGSGDERLNGLTLPGRLRSADSTMSVGGIINPSNIVVKPPSFSEELFAGTLQDAGYPLTDTNLEAVGRQFGEMTLIKSYEGFIAAGDPSGQERFSATHKYEGGPWVAYCQRVLDDLGRAHPGIIPYIQGLPARFRSLILNWERNEPGSGIQGAER